MGFTKKDIERARENYWLKEARKQTGNKNLKSLSEVKIVKKIKKPKYSLGEKLYRLSKRK